jgi:hypothetical protein
MNMQTDRLTGKAHANIQPEYKAHQDCLRFPEQNIPLLLDGNKVTSIITRNGAHIIHHPSLEKYLREKEEWSKRTWNEMAFIQNFIEQDTLRQTTHNNKNALKFMVSNITHFHERAQLKL